MILEKMIATCGGIGYVKGGGTVAAILFTVLWWLIPGFPGNLPVQVVVFLAITIAGVIVSNRVEAGWGKDSSRIVIDEAAGMSLSLLLVPRQWVLVLIALLLFRFFDIVKPLFISRVENLKGGWGVMADDLLAGIYTAVIMKIILLTNLF